MRINSTTVNRSTGTHSVSNDQSVKGKSTFSSRMEPSNPAKKAASSTSPISRETLMALASDFKNGLINKEEANNRFVSAVVDGSLQGKLGQKDCDAMAKDIADFFSDDQEFITKLQKNLRELT